MPDITMCSGGDCPLKETCYRYKAIPNELRQSFFSHPPYKGNECDHYDKVYDKVRLHNR